MNWLIWEPISCQERNLVLLNMFSGSEFTFGSLCLMENTSPSPLETTSSNLCRIVCSSATLLCLSTRVSVYMSLCWQCVHESNFAVHGLVSWRTQESKDPPITGGGSATIIHRAGMLFPLNFAGFWQPICPQGFIKPSDLLLEAFCRRESWESRSLNLSQTWEWNESGRKERMNGRQERLPIQAANKVPPPMELAWIHHCVFTVPLLERGAKRKQNRWVIWFYKNKANIFFFPETCQCLKKKKIWMEHGPWSVNTVEDFLYCRYDSTLAHYFFWETVYPATHIPFSGHYK